ncbi:MAG: hypothetical protein WA859_11435, partial [Candidatus Sulfotelmatobacter sp.]
SLCSPDWVAVRGSASNFCPQTLQTNQVPLRSFFFEPDARHPVYDRRLNQKGPCDHIWASFPRL